MAVRHRRPALSVERAHIVGDTSRRAHDHRHRGGESVVPFPCHVIPSVTGARAQTVLPRFLHTDGRRATCTLRTAAAAAVYRLEVSNRDCCNTLRTGDSESYVHSGRPRTGRPAPAALQRTATTALPTGPRRR